MNIYHLISNKVWGGGEQYVLELAKKQREKGHYVEIVCRRRPEVILPFNHAEFSISTLPLKGITDFDSATRLGRVIKGRNNVIIHVHNFKDAFTACMARKFSENKDVRIVLTRHLVKKGKTGMIYNALYKDIDKIIFVSELAKDTFLKNNPKIDPNKIEVVHNSVQEITLNPQNLHKDFNIDSDKLILMYHGRISPEKGVDVLLKAVSQLDPKMYHLIVAGTGDPDFVGELQSIVRSNRLENNVTFPGFLNNPQDYIKGCDIGVLPSLCRESFGLSNLEYMMNGKPLIASNNGAQKEYMENGKEGILIAPENPYSLAAAINFLLTNPEARKEMGDAAKIKFENDLSYDRFYNKISKIYNEL